MASIKFIGCIGRGQTICGPGEDGVGDGEIRGDMDDEGLAC